MQKTILTRSANESLYKLFKSLWRDDNIFHQCKGFNGYNESLSYLLHLFESDYSGFIINADEDFFIMNENLLDKVIEKMKVNKFAFAGVPDGGVISHRNNSVFNVNPFFNVFNVDLIKTKIKSFDNSKQSYYANRVEKNAKLNEPFAGFLYWLHYEFEHANFTDIESTDGISTVIKINHEPLGIHSWYSRHYGVDAAQTERIDKCLEWAIVNRK